MSDPLPRREFLAKGFALGTALAFPGCLARLVGAEPGTADPGRSLEEIAFCGYDCEHECYIYKATRENDLAVKQQVAKRWADQYGVTIKPEDVACDGCRSEGQRLGYHCGSVCAVRKCARARGVRSCATCDDFPSCDKELWKGWKEMHERTAARRRHHRESRQSTRGEGNSS